MNKKVKNSLDAFSKKRSNFVNENDRELGDVESRLNNELDQSKERLRELLSVCESVTLDDGKIRNLCAMLNAEHRKEEDKISNEVIHPEIEKSRMWNLDTKVGTNSIKESYLSSLVSGNNKLESNEASRSAEFDKCKAEAVSFNDAINNFLRWEKSEQG